MLQVHESLSKSIALTEALRRRSQGLSKKSSISDQYLYTPVFRPKSQSTSIFGSKNKLQESTIKEHDSKEKLDASEKEVDTAIKPSKQQKEEVEYATISHKYTAIDASMLERDDFRVIKIAKFVPGRVQAVLRSLSPGLPYMACITAVNQIGESEAAVVHFKTSGVHSQSSLQTQCALKGKYEMLQNALSYGCQMVVLILGLALFGFLVCFLYANYVHHETCTHIAMSLDDIDVTDLKSVCPQVASDYTCFPNSANSRGDSWINKAVKYFTLDENNET